MPPRTVAGGLDIKAVVDAIDDDLGLSLRLHVAAHDAEGEPGYAASGGESRDDGLKGALAWSVDVGVAVLEGEELAAILKHKSEAVGDEARTHAAEVRLNLGDHEAVAVGGGEVGGVAVTGRLAGIDGGEDFVEADELGAFLCVVF